MRAARSAWAVLLSVLVATQAARFVWVDETCVRSHMTRRYGRGPRGQRLHFATRPRTAQYTLVAAMSLEGGFVARWVFGGKLTRERWAQFVAQHLLPALPAGSLVVWDNLNIHYDQAPIAQVQAARCAQFFCPAYSPEGNPIEYAFSKLKAYLKGRQAQGAKALREAVDEGLARITLEDRQGYYREAMRHVQTWHSTA